MTLVFPANNGSDPVTHTITRTISLQTTQDPDAEDEDVLVDVDGINTGGINISDSDLAPQSIKSADDETQTYVFKVTTEDPEEGTAIAVTLRAEPEHVSGSLMLTLHSDNPKYTIDSTTVNPVVVDMESGQTGEAILINPPGDDGNRAEDSFTLTAHSGSAGDSMERASVTIKVADLNALPAVAMMVVDKDGEVEDPQPTSVEEGTSIMVAVMPLDDDGEDVDAFDAEDLTVTLMATGTADAADYTVVRTITIKMGEEASAPVELEVRPDEDIGRESLMFDAVVSGDSKTGTETRTSPAVLSLYIDDATRPQITPKSADADYDRIKAATADLNPGETVELMTSDLFTVEDGFNAGYSVSVEGDSVSAFASGEVVTINAEMAGESKITVTGTASMSTSSLMPSQTVSNVASLTFPVMVVDTTLEVTLSADPMEIAEGDTSMITATASREITAGVGDVEIDLTVVGDGTLDPESITIAMGAMSGSAMLTATEDDEDFEDETVTVVATGSGIDGTMQVAVAVTDNDEAPAVPNQISAKDQDEAYPVIMAAIAAGGWRR